MKQFCVNLSFHIFFHLSTGQFIPFEDNFNNVKILPDWCGSVGSVSSHKPEGHWFNSQSGHMPGFQARSLVGGV